MIVLSGEGRVHPPVILRRRILVASVGTVSTGQAKSSIWYASFLGMFPHLYSLSDVSQDFGNVLPGKT